ncbi:glycosyltransferase family 2 protein [Bifidobacterium adolescentis]|uniref:glycosyltransferase family 2 protein n=1 Tax=Bifidobacterium adolescentis TaxID=1680 RepID=UPI001E4B6D4D|nr:glycosyltransferase family 2 protein [Bifidobacterium adolescentis]
MPDNSNVSVAVLLPCYNEEVTIGKVVRDFKAALPNADIYVYDNNSTDHTAEIATSEGAIVRKEPRQGKGNVIRAMFEDIDADVYVMADGDDTYPADAAPAMVDKVLEGYDMVIGDRLLLPGEQASIPQLRQPLGARFHQRPVPCECHRHHDRIPCLLVHIRQNLPRIVARLRG